MYSDQPQGHIDGFIGDSIYGWCACGKSDRVAVRVAGHELIHVNIEIPRVDVKISLDLNTDVVGFESFIPNNLCDGLERLVEILVISPERILVVSSVRIAFPKFSIQNEEMPAGHDPRSLRRAAVVCWDLAHNPAGRALVLYEILQREYKHVDLIGPMFTRFGESLWAPLRELNLNVVSSIVNDYADLQRFSDQVSQTTYGIVWICKPRLPSIKIGLQIAEASRCRVVLDIDDYEMSFFKNKDSVELKGKVLENLASGKLHPADFEATAYAHSYIDHFRLKTVSNVSLQRAFGGEIIPHGRSEVEFDPTLFDRQAERDRLGLSQNSSVIGFIGTIRQHKGILDIAKAVGNLGRNDIQLYVAGTYDNEAIKNEIIRLAQGRAILGGEVSFSSLPRNLSACDLICLPQDRDSETSVFQLPAKLVDGLALGLKVLVNDLPVYDDLRNHPGLFIRDPEVSLESTIETVLDSRVDEQTARDEFLGHLSVGSLAIRATSFFNSVRESESVDEMDSVFEAFHMRPLKSDVVTFSAVSVRKKSRDLVVLWKQQDSSLFGRRVDMVAKYLKIGGGYDRIIVIDAPMTAWDLSQLSKRSVSPGLTNSRLLYDACIRKFFGLNVDDGLIFKSFVTSESAENVLGRALVRRRDLWREIRNYLETSEISTDADLLVYPVAPHLGDVLSAWKFSRIMVDLVDDERDFTNDDVVKARKHEAYIDTLCRADMIFTNNDNMKSRFEALSTKGIYVVPNGVERANPADVVPLRLSNLDQNKKVIGYIGNLRDRIDTNLLISIADKFDDAHLLLVGPTGGNRDVERLRFHHNITMAGARTYEESRRIAAGFDVGIIPHTANALTDSMNPLKFYLYRELNIPVVTTPIKNLGKVDDQVFQSDGSTESFIGHVQSALSLKKRSRAFWERRSKDNLWSSRVNGIMKLWNN